ncbi:MAG: hypothetical protein GY914_05095 [Prochlorococcus sp.]|nr:hypothetical protein [Prochlorococcus sp.]
MTNQLMKDVHTLVDEVIEIYNTEAGYTKSLPLFGELGDVAGQRYDDVEYLPQEFRFLANDGYKSKSDNSDVQSVVDRMIPIRRNKSFYIKASLSTKELRDPRLRSMVVKGMSTRLKNEIDTYALSKVMTAAQMVVAIDGDITQSTCSKAFNLMVKNGFSGEAKNLYLSIDHYETLSDALALNQYHGGLPQTAYERSIIPNQISGFDKSVRLDYPFAWNAAAGTGVQISGANQVHTVKTLDSNGNYVDNRYYLINVNSTADIAPGDKFTMVDVNGFNPDVNQDVGALKSFTVMDVVSATILRVNALIIDEPYKIGSAAPATDSAITFLNKKTAQPSIFHVDNAVYLIPGNLPVEPEGAGVQAINAVTDQGLPMRFTYKYDFDEEELFMKAVCYFDVEPWKPEQIGMILTNQA